MRSKTKAATTKDVIGLQRPLLIKRLRLRLSKLLRNWPFLVWLGALGLALYLYQRVPAFGIISGMVSSGSIELAAPDTMILASIDVEPGQKVRAGDIVARLDTRVVDGEIAMQEALLAQNLSQEDYVLQMHRQFVGDVASAEADLLTTKLEMAQAEAEMEVLDAELEILNKLLENGLIDRSGVSPLRAQHAALKQAVKQYPSLLKTLEAHLVDAQRRFEEAKLWLCEDGEFDLLEVMKKRATAQAAVYKTTMDMLKATRETYILRAPNDGMISRINYRPGATVLADDPIIRIASETPDQIVALLREAQATFLEVGMTVYASVDSRTGETPATVISVAPDIANLPTRLNRIDPDLIIRGRRAVLKINGKTDLLPGETVRIRVPASTGLSLLATWQNFWR